MQPQVGLKYDDILQEESDEVQRVRGRFPSHRAIVSMANQSAAVLTLTSCRVTGSWPFDASRKV